MQKYSIFSLIKNAFSNHEKWDLAWKDPSPKKEYDVVIIGGGGHGLATAYYLAKEHKITNVAIIEKGWIGGGNIGRNTTIIRSNFMYDDNAKFNEFGMLLDESWKIKKKLSKYISNSTVDNIYKLAIKNGALGGKILGAGGGGFFLFYVPNEIRKRFLKKMDFLLNINFKFEDEGSRIILKDEDEKI